jgi:heme A synthase
MTLTFIMMLAIIAIFTGFTVTSNKWMKTARYAAVALALLGCSTIMLASPIWLSVIHNTQIV